MFVDHGEQSADMVRMAAVRLYALADDISPGRANPVWDDLSKETQTDYIRRVRAVINSLRYLQLPALEHVGTMSGYSDDAESPDRDHFRWWQDMLNYVLCTDRSDVMS